MARSGASTSRAARGGPAFASATRRLRRRDSVPSPPRAGSSGSWVGPARWTGRGRGGVLPLPRARSPDPGIRTVPCRLSLRAALAQIREDGFAGRADAEQGAGFGDAPVRGAQGEEFGGGRGGDGVAGGEPLEQGALFGDEPGDRVVVAAGAAGGDRAEAAQVVEEGTAGVIGGVGDGDDAGAAGRREDGELHGVEVGDPPVQDEAGVADVP